MSPSRRKSRRSGATTRGDGPLPWIRNMVTLQHPHSPHIRSVSPLHRGRGLSFIHRRSRASPIVWAFRGPTFVERRRYGEDPDERQPPLIPEPTVLQMLTGPLLLRFAQAFVALSKVVALAQAWRTMATDKTFGMTCRNPVATWWTRQAGNSGRLCRTVLLWYLSSAFGMMRFSCCLAWPCWQARPGWL